jgi:signal transduction histidine kinase
MLDDLGLSPALGWLVREMSRSSGIDIRTEIDPAGDQLPDAYRTCLYRVVQEALTNASRHSGAHNIQVILKLDGPWVRAVISDDGAGFGTELGSELGEQKSLGLLGMEERARELGGSMRVISFPGRGTRVEIELPGPIRPAEPEGIDAANLDRGRSRDRSSRSEASA